MIKTANLMRKGSTGSTGWDDETWATRLMPTTEWRIITIVTVVPTISLLTDDLQSQLAQLYAEKLSYVPSLAINQLHGSAKYTMARTMPSRTISQVGIRIGYYIDSLSIAYLDGIASCGDGRGGVKHTFALANGDYIIEMLTYTGDGDWLRGIHFITNTGRCSAIYGRWEGTPVIARSRGGILAGFSIRTRLDPNDNEVVAGVWGIRRRDYVPRARKKNDAYSDFFGAKTHSGICFNDRAIVGNLHSTYVSSIGVGSGVEIDSVQITYMVTKNGQNGRIKTTRHGGPGGSAHQFELGDEEYAVSVSGRHNEKFLAQLCFKINLGRQNGRYGQGDGQEFSVRAPLDENGQHLRLQYVIGKKVNT